MSMPDHVGVLLVRSPDYIQGVLRGMLERDPRFQVTATASSLLEAVDVARAARPDAVLLAPTRTEPGVVETCRVLRDHVPAGQLVVLRAFADREVACALSAMGASVVLMDLDPAELLSSLLPRGGFGARF